MKYRKLGYYLMSEQANTQKKLTSLFDEEVYNRLNEYSFKDIEGCYKLVKKLYKLCDGFDINLKKILYFVNILGEGDKALKAFVLLVERSKSRQRLIKYILSDPLFLKFLPQVLILPYVVRILTLDPGWLYWVLGQDLHILKSINMYLEGLRSFESDNFTNKYYHINLYKNRETFRVVVKELLGGDYLDIEKELSNLADACFSRVHDIINDEYKGRYGSVDSGGLSVIALERLGASELCYSSRVSILFIYSGVGRSDGSSKLEAYNYYANFTKRFVDIIDGESGDYIYKLRYPKRHKGERVPRVYTIDEYISSLESHDTVFERFQFTKARFCCGDIDLGESFLKHATAIAYRKYLSLEDIYGIKGLIGSFSNSRVIKLKDIEMVVQMIQLFHGGKVPDIQTQNTLDAINRLFYTGLLNKDERDILRDGYYFFKLLEHESELFDKEPGNSLLVNEKVLKAIAKNLGSLPVTDKNADTVFKDYYNNISSEFLRTLKGYFKALIRIKNPSFLYLLHHKPRLIQHLIARYHFKYPKNAFNIIKDLVPVTQKGSEAFVNILPIFLEEIKKSPDRDLLLINFSKAIKSYNSKDSLFEFFDYNRKIVCYLSKVFSISEFLSEILIQHPELFEDITRKDFFEYKYSIASLKRDFKEILKFTSFEEAIFTFKNYEIFRIGLKSIVGLTDIIITTYELSILAEVILFLCIEHFLGELSSKKGIPSSEVAIILLGKLGGRELSFGSDLDIFIVYEKKGEIVPGYYNALFFNELIIKVSRFLSYPSASGTLYEVDLKLRPYGKNAPMVISAEKFDDYLQNKGAIWEKLVYTKARVMSTSNRFKEEVKGIIDRFIYAPIDTLGLKKEVVHMRKRIVDNAIKKNGKYLFKKGEGGLLDLEFLAQYLNILYGRENRHLRKKNIFNLYHSLYHYDIITLKDFKTIRVSLLFLKSIEMVLRIMSNYSHDKLPDSREGVSKLAIKLGFSDYSTFMSKYNFVINEVRSIYRKFLLS